MSERISILVGLKNNLEYTKKFYETTRALYPEVEIVFVSYNSTDATHQWLDTLDDQYLIYHYETVNATFSDTFNKCTALATKPFVLYAHNDLILAPLFFENIEKLLDENKVVVYSTIEPPIFSDHERDGKIIKDFGLDVDHVDVSGMYEFVEGYRSNLVKSSKKIERASFFLTVSRLKLIDIGGLDPIYDPMFCEDDDLTLRLQLMGLEAYIALDAICYHFVSKTSRFSEEYKSRTKIIELNSQRNFVRKWHFSNTSEIKKRYDIGFVLKNASKELIYLIEPWCNTLYIDSDPGSYISEEQPLTKIDLSAKIKKLSELSSHDVMVKLDGNKVTGRVGNAIANLNEVVFKRAKKNNGSLLGWFNTLFDFGTLKISVNKHRGSELELINRTRYDNDVF